VFVFVVVLFWVFVLLCFFETRFLYVALAVVEFCSVDQAGLESQRSTCLCLPNAGIKGAHHHPAWTFNNLGAGHPGLTFVLRSNVPAESLSCLPS